ncbi:MAG TPA: EfeM/EfeO family lipoprotein [Stellaceae bacterium]|nr:EfeM/EfeO family lipoprotein [Stellaceae bacterium]HXC27352.1 EfeM/EfeO family lipoprotein [Stellaceae bacterium]
MPRAIGKVAAALRLWRLSSVIAAGLGGGLALSAAVCAAPSVSPAPGDNLSEAAEHYRPIMVRDIDRSLAGARLLRARLAAGDVPGAQKAWIDSRVGWERSEVFTSGFVPDLDREIDAWPNALLGFHAIEAKLFGAKRTDLKPETDALILNLEDLDVKIRHLDLLPQRLLNGTARLAYEIGESKADGGESAFSGTSLSDMRDNVDGIEIAYETIFAAAVEAGDPKLAPAIPLKIAELKTLVGVPDLKSLDPERLRAASEELIVLLQTAAPEIGLRAPSLEEIAQ